MNIETLIQNAMNKDASSFEDTFNTIMSDKMSKAIENKYNQMFNVDDQEDISLETETLETEEDE